MADIIFGLKISGIGITVVFISLILISWMVSLLGQLTTEKAPKVDTSKDASPVVEDGVTPEVVAVISAAIATTINKKFKIKRVRYRSLRPGSDWAKQGIGSIMGSHAIQRKH